MKAEKAKHKASQALWGVVWLLGQVRDHLEDMEHPALGVVERLIERLREEQAELQAELQRRNPK